MSPVADTAGDTAFYRKGERSTHSYPFYFNDWRNSEAVQAMTCEEKGIYRELLDQCWIEGDLPSDERTLRKMVGASEEEWGRSWPTVSHQFRHYQGRLRNPKVDQKRPGVVNSKRSRSESASMAAKARWSGHQQAKKTDASGMRPSDATPHATPYASQLTHTSEDNESAADNASRMTHADASRCGTPSPSGVVNTSSFRKNLEDSSVTEQPPPVRHSPRNGSHPGEKLAAAQAFDEQWQQYIGAFVASGAEIAIAAVNEAWGCWLKLGFDQRQAAVDHTQKLARDTPGKFMPNPVRYIRERRWNQIAEVRTLPDPKTISKTERTNELFDGLMREEYAKTQRK